MHIRQSLRGDIPIQIPLSENSDLIDDIQSFYRDHKSIQIIENMNIDEHFEIPFAKESEISDIIKALDISKASGLD